MWLAESEQLIDLLSVKSPLEIEKMMKISPKLAELNAERFHQWSRPFNLSNSNQAVFAFQGDVYTGLQAQKFTKKQLDYVQDHLRILSGLYGVLRPLDLMQAYRLEMGISLANSKGKNLYEFWDNKITNHLNLQLETIESKLLINLASKEYFKSIKADMINAKIITPVFKDWSNGNYKILSFFAKKARGSMAAWLLKNKVKSVRKLIQFDIDGYRYSSDHSEPHAPVFLRRLN
jgi:cytoplasmic iron level regulating protein YaaA (DUF328/UPF0246 family)